MPMWSTARLKKVLDKAVKLTDISDKVVMFILRALMLLKSGELYNFVDTCRMGTSLRECKFTNV
jgi:hypothetical protein